MLKLPSSPSFRRYLACRDKTGNAETSTRHTSDLVRAMRLKKELLETTTKTSKRLTSRSVVGSMM